MWKLFSCCISEMIQYYSVYIFSMYFYAYIGVVGRTGARQDSLSNRVLLYHEHENDVLLLERLATLTFGECFFMRFARIFPS